MKDAMPRLALSGGATAADVADLASNPPQRRRRADVQALRAVAIAGVVIQHLGGEWLSGGFLGVDVFFVVSGYLITAHLVRDAEAGTLSLAAFWARRVRRLMPASLVTLAATAIAIVAWTPQYLWRQFLTETLASAVYVQNWLLIITGSDYFTETNPASPTLHFWSLSLEEQFYLVWPVLILVVFAALRGRSRRQRTQALALVLLVLGVVSFLWAQWAASAAPIFNFYATSSRVWEFAIGGLVALGPVLLYERGVALRSLSRDLRTVGATLAWIGLLASFAILDGDSPHPGAATLWPTVATAAIIAVGHGTATGAIPRVVARRPIQALGAISYSLYLWHWPVIVVSAYALPGASPAALIAAQALTSIILATLSYLIVERPTQRRGMDAWFRPPRVFVRLMAATLIVALATAPGWFQLRAQSAEAETAGAVMATTDPCFGARSSSTPEECSTAGDTVVPPPAVAWGDHPDMMVNGGCYASRTTNDFGVCHLDESDGEGLRVLLVGDSHARDLSPTMSSIAEMKGWDLYTTARVACGYIFAAYGSTRRTDAENAACYAWRDKVTHLIRTTQFDLVVNVGQQGVTWAGDSPAQREAAGIAGASEAFDVILAAGAHVVTLEDPPLPAPGVFDCVERHGPEAVQSCTQPVDEAFRKDTLASAAASYSPADVTLIRTRDIYCDDATCSPVVGGVFVYSDEAGHINSVWATSLADVIAARLPSFASRSPAGSPTD